MSSIEYERNGEFIDELTYTPTGENNPATAHEWEAYRRLEISVSDGGLTTGGSDTETVTVRAISNLDYHSNDRDTTLDIDKSVTVIIDGQGVTKTLSGGSVSFDLTTQKPAGSEIEIVAESLADHPAESDSATIEVVEA